MVRRQLGLALVLAAAGCPRPEPGAGAVRPGEPAITSTAEAQAALGKRVVVAGTAGNAKLGGVVRQPGFMVYCLNMPEWAPDKDGQPVRVLGTLEYTTEFQAQTTPNGAVSAGTGGGVYVIRQCEVR